jgi:hypothetical protein
LTFCCEVRREQLVRLALRRLDGAPLAQREDALEGRGVNA